MFLDYQTRSSLVKIDCGNVFLFVEFIIFDRDVRDIGISLIFDKLWVCRNINRTMVHNIIYKNKV